ncbi:MAG: hypothetical protein IJX76_07240 [Clostridia bacterium]|nr:hypothetical protein [Clostridia bacterium]
MKKISLLLATLTLSAALIPALSSCTKQEEVTTPEPLYVSVPFEDKGFTAVQIESAEAESLDSKFLEFPSADQKVLPKSGFSAKGLINNFNTVYPTLAEMWSHGKINDVVYTVNTTDDGAADTRGTGVANKLLITMYYQFLKSSGTGGLDCITHELTHVVQENYNTGYGGEDTDDNGSWIVEGMTDYSRYVFGMYPGDFALPAYSKAQSYTDSYRVTARFFIWIEENICPTFAEQMNEALRTERYTSQFFNQITGYGLKELWAMYDADGGKVTDYRTGQKTSGAVVRSAAYEFNIELPE